MLMLNYARHYVAPGQGERFSMMGVTITPKILAEETGGAFSMVEQVVEPRAGSPPYIVHREAKVIYVVEGEFEFRLGDETRRGGAGAVITIPNGAVHNFTNVGATPGKLVVAFLPGGHEEFLRDLAELMQDEFVTPEAMRQVTERHGVEMVPEAAQ